MRAAAATTAGNGGVEGPPSASAAFRKLSSSSFSQFPQQQQQPRALLHFLGGALVGAAPQLSYRYLLERLASRGYLIVATPYKLSFDHLKTCDEVVGRFEKVAPELARRE